MIKRYRLSTRHGDPKMRHHNHGTYYLCKDVEDLEKKLSMAAEALGLLKTNGNCFCDLWMAGTTQTKHSEKCDNAREALQKIKEDD